MKSSQKYLIVALMGVSVFLSVSAYIQSQPEEKNNAMYIKIHHYSPYYLDKRFGGLQILSKIDKNFKEQPSNIEVFHRLDALEKKWGKEHLTMDATHLSISDETNTTVATVLIKTHEERHFVHQFYGIK
jgi:hypothetical protein